MKIPSTWGFTLVCMVLRAAEGVGSAMFYTATFSTFPKLFPNHVSLMVVSSLSFILCTVKSIARLLF